MAEIEVLDGDITALEVDAIANAAEGLKTAEGLNFPVILKAAHGGGGRGMRVVQQARDFADAFDTARRESLNAFGSDEIFVEKRIITGVLVRAGRLLHHDVRIPRSMIAGLSHQRIRLTVTAEDGKQIVAGPLMGSTGEHHVGFSAVDVTVWFALVGLLLALTGAALLPLLALHIIANHFVAEGGLRDYADVVSYLSHPVILGLETLFLVVVTAHALLGVRARGQHAVALVALQPGEPHAPQRPGEIGQLGRGRVVVNSVMTGKGVIHARVVVDRNARMRRQ